jgi:diguanylate cyclase (GGDEF)-like protein
MLHPAFESFFSFARGVGELADLPPIREEHEQHVNSFLEVLRRHAGGSPELGLAAEMLGRLWRRNRELAELSKTDALTQVLNRRGFFDAARSVAHLSQRHGYPVGVLLLDVDDFKQVNDQFGHEAGDRALAAVAGKVAGSVRRSDLVGRLGGEEFGVFLSRIETGGALAAGEKTRQAVAGIDTLGFAVTVSVGAVAGSLAVPVEEGLEGLMRRADAAMYRAKAEGKNRVVAERP